MQVKAFPAARRPRVEMVPLIDMFFLLLVFFIFGIFSMSMQQGIIVDLPSAQTAAPSPHERTLTISVTADGAIVADGTAVALDALGAWLRRSHPVAARTSALINADRAAAHGVVITVLDYVRQAGIQHVSFQTQPASP